MLIKRLIGVSIFIALFVYPVAAQSPKTQQEIIKPIPKQDRTTTTSPPQISQQQTRTNDQQRTSTAPAVKTNEIKPPISNIASDDFYDYQKENLKIQAQLSESTKNIADLTFFLVVVGFIQAFIFGAQIIFLRGTLRATAKAANAADASAKALTASERAYLFVTIIMKTPDAENIAGIADKEPQYNEGIVKLIVTNHGKTPAILTAYPYTTEVLTSNEIDKKIDKLTSDDIETWVPFGPVVIDSNTALKEWSTGFFINDKKWRQISMEEAFLACIGCLHYQDIFGKTHKTVFCWKYEQFSGFHYDKDPKRNYRT